MFKRQGIFYFLNLWKCLNIISWQDVAAELVPPLAALRGFIETLHDLWGSQGTSHRSRGPQGSVWGTCRPNYCGTPSSPGSSISSVFVSLWADLIHPLLFSLTSPLCNLSLSIRRQRPINRPTKQEKCLLLGQRLGGKVGTIYSSMSLENWTPLILSSEEAAKATHLHSPSQSSQPRKYKKASAQMAQHRLGKTAPPGYLSLGSHLTAAVSGHDSHCAASYEKWWA